MASLPYRAITYKPYEVISKDNMNQEAANIQWLYEYTPRVLYTSPRIKRREGVRIASGKAAFQKQKDDQAQVTVRFEEFFSRYCQPNIALGVMTTGQNKIFATYSGLSGLMPDHTGFRIRVEVNDDKKKRDRISKQFYVSWIAMGH